MGITKPNPTRYRSCRLDSQHNKQKKRQKEMHVNIIQHRTQQFKTANTHFTQSKDYHKSPTHSLARILTSPSSPHTSPHLTSPRLALLPPPPLPPPLPPPPTDAQLPPPLIPPLAASPHSHSQPPSPSPPLTNNFSLAPGRDH